MQPESLLCHSKRKKYVKITLSESPAARQAREPDMENIQLGTISKRAFKTERCKITCC